MSIPSWLIGCAKGWICLRIRRTGADVIACFVAGCFVFCGDGWVYLDPEGELEALNIYKKPAEVQANRRI